METPKTYYGFDKDNVQIVSCTANDANEIVNPETVKAAIDAVEQAASSGTQDIIGALNSVAPDADDAVIVQGTKMTGVIEEVCSALETIPGSVLDSVSSYYDEAVKIHDKYQIEYNTQAKNQVSSHEGVVRVSG